MDESFDKIPDNTRTTIVMTNLVIDIQKLFTRLPISEYVVVQKKRGRKKKTDVENPNKDVKEKSIITLEYENELRGVRLKKKKKTSAKKGEAYFRNSLTTVMVVCGRNVNFKITRNGKFQLTGCKSDEQIELCIKYIWDYIKDDHEMYKIVSFDTQEECDELNVMFIPAMRNIYFNLGYTIDREKVDKHFNTIPNYYSLLETSIGYTGVNIKVLYDKSIYDLKVDKMVYKNGEWCEKSKASYEEYLNVLKPKDRQKKIDKSRYHTFLIFHSGKVIMSSISKEFSEAVYYQFINIMKNKQMFEEKLRN